MMHSYEAEKRRTLQQQSLVLESMKRMFDEMDTKFDAVLQGTGVH